MEKTFEQNQVQHNEKFRKPKVNTRVIFCINLKMTFKNPGVIVAFILHLLALIAILFVETSVGIQPQSIKDISTYKVLFYVLTTLSTIFFVMMLMLFLFKKQKKSGIHAIELRAGLATWKSYIIRFLVAFSVITIANLIILGFVAILGILMPVSNELYLAFPYSQAAFNFFLAIIIILILLPLFIYSSTMVGTLLSTVLMFAFSLSPIFASIRYSFMGRDVQDDYALKFNAINDFYNATKNDQNVNKIFQDEAVSTTDSRSKLLTTIEKNFVGSSTSQFKSLAFPIPQNIKDYSNNLMRKSESEEQYPINPYEWNLVNNDPSTMNNNFLSIPFTSLIWDSILTDSLSIGQVNYDFSYVPSVSKTQRIKKSIFEGTEIKNVLDKIYDALEKNQSNISSNNENQIPSLFINKQSQYKAVKTKTILVNNFARQLGNYIPEFSNILNSVAKIYDKYAAVFNEQQTSILKNSKPLNVVYNYNSDGYKAEDFYTSDFRANSFSSRQLYNPVNNPNKGKNYREAYSVDYAYFSEYKKYKAQSNEEANNQNEYDLGDTGLEELNDNEKSIIENNKKVENLYKKFPEITIINWLIVNMWYESLAIAVSSVDDLYDYYVNSKNGSKLTFDIFRHFAVMSSGLLSNSSINDSYNNYSGAPIYQGQTSSIKNILDYEKYLPEYVDSYNVQKPYLEEGAVIYKNSFIIPLAYAMYLLIASPLAYLGYLAYRKKIRV
ncbi:hypothetical protein [Spiroplasma tabanidicola]|uniref:ABC transporter permease n=1 Tax=Spiroplasma tabanidicola TaxID=324079 RepID=A0A6I6CC77_9MOLU|nr:hypothetical protein [Spiroplasma tabanidicola]QGS51554.1 ABC transporter permease [Spiroplasma tabanidicola]